MTGLYCVATDQYDFTAEGTAMIYKLSRNIETVFAWWKRHVKVYHVIARSRYGSTVQMRIKIKIKLVKLNKCISTVAKARIYNFPFATCKNLTGMS
jgi:hypothetical protein